MSENASEKMGKKNVVFTKDGVKVGVKQVQNERYVDATQSWVVKAWNLGNAKEDSNELYVSIYIIWNQIVWLIELIGRRRRNEPRLT